MPVCAVSFFTLLSSVLSYLLLFKQHIDQHYYSFFQCFNNFFRHFFTSFQYCFLLHKPNYHSQNIWYGFHICSISYNIYRSSSFLYFRIIAAAPFAILFDDYDRPGQVQHDVSFFISVHIITSFYIFRVLVQLAWHHFSPSVIYIRRIFP